MLRLRISFITANSLQSFAKTAVILIFNKYRSLKFCYEVSGAAAVAKAPRAELYQHHYETGNRTNRAKYLKNSLLTHSSDFLLFEEVGGGDFSLL